MKKFILLLLFVSLSVAAQDRYWTAYNFSVQGKDAETVVAIMDGYFKENLPEGVSVELYENHFKDTNNNYSHQLIWSGPLDDLSQQYMSDGGDAWSLMITRVNRHIDSFHSASMGTRSFALAKGDWKISDFPFQQIIEISAEDQQAFFKAFKEYQSKYNPDDRVVMSGNIKLGRNKDDGNTWILLGYKDFKSLFGGPAVMKGPYSNEKRRQAWRAYLEKREDNEFQTSTMRILVKSWN